MKIASYFSKFGKKDTPTKAARERPRNPSNRYSDRENAETSALLLKSDSGSILAEIAVGIFILAIISGFVVRKNLAINKQMRERLTRENIETVAMSLASFVANNYRLPKPAADINGIESASAKTFGYVPYKTLGISARTAQDGNLRPLVYVVEPKLTKDFSQIYRSDFVDFCFCYDISDPSIKISGYDMTDVIAFVIDIGDNSHEMGQNTVVHPSGSTFYITRDVLLMKYLKDVPCRRRGPIGAFTP